MASEFRNIFNNNRIVITPYGLVSPKVHGLIRVAHLSDLHQKEFGSRNAELFQAVRSIEPHIIAITGDLVAHENQKTMDMEYVRTLGAGLSQIAPTFFVTGNHEYRFAAEICDVLEEEDVSVLHNRYVTLDVEGNRVNVGGMHDISFGPGHMEAAIPMFREVPGYNIFLSHRPEVFDAFQQSNIDLMLAGHTHGGQIRIPEVTTLYMIGQGLFPKYMEGEFTVGSTTMIISRGLGSSGYPAVRLNNPPDLVAIQIEGADEAAAEAITEDEGD